MRGILLALALAAGSCGGGGGASSNGLSDGTWDVTFSRTDYSTGTLTVSGNSATLTLQERASSVTQREIAVALAGTTGSGTITKIVNGQRSLESTFTVTGPSRSFGSLDGDWTVSRPGTTDAHVHFGGGMFAGGSTLSGPGYTFMGTLASTVLSGTDSSGSEFAAMRR
jgi:hypothetical protein